MVALLDHASPVEDEDRVGGEDGGEAVGDHDRGAAREQRAQRRLDQLLREAVEVRGRLVEDQDPGVLEDDAGDREPLLLAAGEAVAALADDRPVAVREGGDELVEVRGPGGRLELVDGRLGAGVEEVAPDRVVPEEGVLEDDADGLADRLQRQLAQVVSVDPHRAGGRVVEAGDQVAGRRLAGAARPDEGDERPGSTRKLTSSSAGRPPPCRYVRPPRVWRSEHATSHRLARHRRNGRRPTAEIGGAGSLEAVDFALGGAPGDRRRRASAGEVTPREARVTARRARGGNRVSPTLCAWQDSNLRPCAPEAHALSPELQAREP